MRYVYLLESEAFAGQRYVGVTSDLKQRLLDHNAGKSSHTSKFRPWKLVTYVAFSNEQKAEGFERYLKSGSGHAFARKRLFPAKESSPRKLPPPTSVPPNATGPLSAIATGTVAPVFTPLMNSDVVPRHY